MGNVGKALKLLLSSEGIEAFQKPESIMGHLDKLSGLSVMERNLLERCAFYQMFPEAVFQNESAANRNAQRIASALAKKHGIEEKYAQDIAVEICSAFSEEGIKINVFNAPTQAAPQKAAFAAQKQEEKPKKKGLFSFFRKG